MSYLVSWGLQQRLEILRGGQMIDLLRGKAYSATGRHSMDMYVYNIRPISVRFRNLYLLPALDDRPMVPKLLPMVVQGGKTGSNVLNVRYIAHCILSTACIEQ